MKRQCLKRIIAQIKKRRSKDSDKSNQIIAIVEISTQIQQVKDLLLCEKGLAANQVVILPISPQRGFVFLNIRERPKKDHNVPRLRLAKH